MTSPILTNISATTVPTSVRRRTKCDNCGESFLTGFYSTHYSECIKRYVIIEKTGHQHYKRTRPYINNTKIQTSVPTPQPNEQ